MSTTENPIPEGSQILLKVIATGVCHSDLHLWDGGYDLGNGTFMKVTDRGVRYPVTPGHEIVGEVAQTGTDTGGYAEGDQVLVYPWIGCGNCRACQNDTENLCDQPRSLGVFQDGGYADYVLIPHHRYLTRVDGMDTESLTSLACSGLTAYTAIKKAVSNSPRYLMLIGAGGLGLMGVQVARAISDATIISVDLDDRKLETAKSMGAHHTLNSRDPDIVNQIIKVCDGMGTDSVVDFVNTSSTAKMGMDVLRKRGNLVLVGLFGGSLNISLVTIPLKALTIQGAYTGGYADMVELVSLAKQGKLNPLISKRYTLDESTNALEDLRGHKIVGRAVINP